MNIITIRLWWKPYPSVNNNKIYNIGVCCGFQICCETQPVAVWNIISPLGREVNHQSYTQFCTRWDWLGKGILLSWWFRIICNQWWHTQRTTTNRTEGLTLLLSDSLAQLLRFVILILSKWCSLCIVYN